MSQRTIVELVDDLDGGNADETITFALDGVEYEIDLSERNGAKLRDALSTYTATARRTGGRRKPTGKSNSAPKATASTASTALTTSTAQVPTNAEVRRWAVEQGYEIAAQGRVPRRIVAAYQEAH